MIVVIVSIKCKYHSLQSLIWMHLFLVPITAERNAILFLNKQNRATNTQRNNKKINTKGDWTVKLKEEHRVVLCSLNKGGILTTLSRGANVETKWHFRLYYSISDFKFHFSDLSFQVSQDAKNKREEPVNGPAWMKHSIHSYIANSILNVVLTQIIL